MDTESVLMVTRWQGGVGEWGRGEAIKNKLVVTEYRIARLVTEQPWGCKAQCRKWSSQRTYMHDPWTQTMVWGLPKEVGGAGQSGAKGENQDNYNSIINRI